MNDSTYNTDLDINNVVISALKKSIQALKRDLEQKDAAGMILGNHGVASKLKKQKIYEQRNLLIGLLDAKVKLKNHIETVDTENLMVRTQTSEFLPDFVKEEEKENK